MTENRSAYYDRTDLPRFVYVLCVVAVLLGLLLAGCASPAPRVHEVQPTRTPAATGSPATTVSVPPAARYAINVTNPWLPMRPGAEWVYAETTPDGNQTDTVLITTERLTITGAPVLVQRDIARDANGHPLEDTRDYFAQAANGNVEYFGEDTAELDPKTGKVISTEGQWRAGRNGAMPGIVMLAVPKPGARYREEFYPGHAEDAATVVGFADVTAGGKVYRQALVIDETSRLDPGTVERKWYAKGVGMVRSQLLQGGPETAELVSVRGLP